MLLCTWEQSRGIIRDKNEGGYFMKKLCKYAAMTVLAGTMLLGSCLTASASSVTSVTAAPETAVLETTQTAEAKTDISTLFDAEYYRKANPDLEKIFGNDAEALYAHFMRGGIYEGRVCTPLFDVKRYKERYPDLAEKYGDDNVKYYEEYLTEGIAQGRCGEGLFDAVAYANAYPDLKAAYGYDLNALYQHFITTGIYEGRLEGLNFNYWCYGALNPELGKAYADHPERLFLQYVDEGLEQGLAGARTSNEYRYIYCEKGGYGAETNHLIKKWTVAQMPEEGKTGYDEAYCEVCGQHFRDRMDMNDYYVRHEHRPEPVYNSWHHLK